MSARPPPRQQRKSHAKSRNGCLQCKRKHLKCDEGGPPCANCVVRDTGDACRYGPGAKPSPQQARGSPSSSSTSDSQVTQHSPSPSHDLMPRSPNRRLLEMELMHQWSVSTFRGFVSTQPDIHTMQVELPRWCLQHEFLMNGLLAVSALELALTIYADDPMKQALYLQYAMEYYDKGSTEFREEILSITESSATSLYMFSSYAWVMSVATPLGVIYHAESVPKILERTLRLLDLVMGSSMIAAQGIAWMMQGPLGSSLDIVIKSFAEKGEEDWVDQDAEEIFKKLAYLNDHSEESENFPQEACKTTLVYLRLVYREEMRSRVKGSAMAFLTIAGRPFAAACKNLEQMSLLMLGVWAVMVDKLDRVDKIWWARGGGRLLVDDITGRLSTDQSPISSLPEFWDCIQWMRQKVMLDSFSNMVL